MNTQLFSFSNSYISQLMSSEPVGFDPDLVFGIGNGGDKVRILSYAAEGIPITRSDVQQYQSQLVAVRQQSSAQIAKPLIGLLSSVDNPLKMQTGEGMTGPTPVSRAFGLSDEQQSARAVAGVDKAEIERIMNTLQFDLEPVHRPWSTQQQQAAESSNFYNYGLNDKLLREYISAQIAIRIEKSRRVKLVGTSDVAGNRDNAAMRGRF
jgi:hypothetical protein